MADLTRCTGRSEAPAEGHGGAHSFSSRPFSAAPAVRAGACRVVGGRKGCGKAGSSVPRALALPDSGKKRCVMLERSQGGARVWAARAACGIM